MRSAKDIRVAPITSKAANALVKRVHYSGKVTPNSQLHLGVFLDGNLEGVMQFGPPMMKTGLIGLVTDTPWNGFMELNRMAFSDVLPRNSESRALGVAFRLMRKHYPHLQWIVSFSDGTQCGDGTIYRASGFTLTQIKPNSSLLRLPTGEVVADMTLHHANHANSGRDAKWWKANGATPLTGFQLRYLYFLHPTARERFTGDDVPFSKIDEMGAGMYLGERRAKQAMASVQDEQRRSGTDPHAPNPKDSTEQPDAE